MAREPTSLITDSMPASGEPLEEGQDVTIEDDGEDLDFGGLSSSPQIGRAHV